MDILATKDGVCLLEFEERSELNAEIEILEKHFKATREQGTNTHIDSLEKELVTYFKGELKTFKTPLICQGSDFQLRVWDALLKIPYGVTRTYKEQTATLGDPKAIRAVASANGKNKIAIVIPCHRVIGSDGSLTGYAGGIDRKRFLLNLERKIAGPKDLFSQ
jgi:O-6-methylguanine DNA methyltransferase